jgi:hypothetical protein
MNSWQGLKQFGFIFELLIISTALSYLIKYGGQYLSIFVIPQNALLIVLMPSVVMAIALLLRYAIASKQPQNNS